jgi:autotransporter-associated beta strand protein
MKTQNKHIKCARIARLLAVGAIMAATARGGDYYWTGTDRNPVSAGNWKIGSTTGQAATTAPGAGDNIFLTNSGTERIVLNSVAAPLRTYNNLTTVSSAAANKFTIELGNTALALTGTLFVNTGLTTSIYGVASAVTINTLQMDGGIFQINNGGMQAVRALEIGAINFNAGAIFIAVSPVATGGNGATVTSTYSLGKINISGTVTNPMRTLYLANHSGTNENALTLNSTVLTTGIEDMPGASGGTRIIGSSISSTTNRVTLVMDVDGLSSYETQARFEDTIPTAPGKGILTIRKTGAGTQVLSNSDANVAYSGGTELVSGTLGVGNSKALGTGTLTVMPGSPPSTPPVLAFYANNINLANPLALASAATLDSRTFTGTLSGALSGAGAFSKTGSGTLALTGDTSAFTGAAAIRAGVLRLAGAGSLDTSGTVTIAAGATLAGNLARAAGRAIAGSGTLDGNLTLNGGSLLFDMAGPSFAPLSITNTLAFATNGNSNIELGTPATGTFHLVTAGTISGAAADYTILSNGAPLTARNDYQFTVSATEMILENKVVSLDLTWTGADGAGAAWAASGTAAANWTGGGDGTVKETHFATGDAVTFAGGGGTIAVDAAGVTASEMRVQGGGTHVFNGGVITTSSAGALAGSALTGASGKLIKTGAGVLVFKNSANTFTDGIETSGGVIAFDNNNQLGDGGNGILFSDDAALRADADALTLSSNIKIAAGKTAAIDTQGSTLSYSGTISLAGASGTFAKTGAGLLLLTADNDAYTGDTIVSEGSLILGSGGRLGGNVYINTAGATFGGRGDTNDSLDNNVTITGGGIFRVGGGASSGTLTVGGTLSLTDSGIAFNLYDNSESDTLLFANGGTAVFTGSATIDFHPTTAATGTFFISNDKSLASVGITVDRQVIDAASRQEARWDTSGAGLDFVYGLDASRVMTWTGGAGDAAWNSDGSANWSGSDGKTKFLHGDAVRFAATGGDTAIAIAVADARVASLAIDTAAGATLTFTGLGLSANGAFATGAEVTAAGLATGRLVKTGAGTLRLGNTANTFAGGITLAGGALEFSTAAQLGSGAVPITAAPAAAGTPPTLRPVGGDVTLTNAITLAASAASAAAAPADNAALAANFGLRRPVAALDGATCRAAPTASDITNPSTPAGGEINWQTVGLRPRNPVKSGDRSPHSINTASGATTATTAASTAAAATHAAVGIFGLRRPVAALDGATRRAAPDASDLTNPSTPAGGEINFPVQSGDRSPHSINTASVTTTASVTAAATAAAAPSASLVLPAASLILDTPAATTLTLAGTTGGAGTLAKTGAGALVLSGSAPLGHAVTRIDAGLVALRDITAAAAPTISHTFALNGGWLDLSDAAANPYNPAGATALDWAGLTFTGVGDTAGGGDGSTTATGGVIGANDKLTLRAGDHAYDIGSATVAGLSGAASGTGIFVEIDAGPGGLATLSGVNNYAGHTVLRSGTLRVTADAQLGLAALNREIIFATDAATDGGDAAALELADGFTTTRTVELRADGKIAVPAGADSPAGVTGATAILAGPVTGAGALVKTGDGTLVLAAATTGRAGATVVQSGTLEGRAGALRGDIAVNAGAALVFNPSGVEIFSGHVTGAGEVVLASGELRAAAGNVFSAAALHRIAAGTTLRLDGFSQTLGGLRNSGTVVIGAAGGATGARLTIRGDYHGDAGSTLELNWRVDTTGALLTDLVEITGQSTGETRVNFTAPDGTRNILAGADLDLAGTRFLIAGPGAADVFSGDYLINDLPYSLSLDAAGNLAFTPADLSFPGAAVPAGLELAALFSGKAAGETLARRLAALRDWNAWGDGARRRDRMNLWLDGVYRHDRLSATVRRGMKITTRGAQAGADYARASAGAGGGFYALGFFADTISGDLDAGTGALPAETETRGIGVYGLWSTRSGYIDLMFRASSDRYRADTPAVSALNLPVRNLDLSGHSLGAAIGTGRVLTAAGWRIEPRLQAAWWRTGAARDAGGGYDLRELRSITTGASVLVARPCAAGRFLPYARLGVEQEISSDRTRAAMMPDDLSGALGAADLGAALRLGSHLFVAADASMYCGNKYNGYSASLGLRLNW